MTSITHSNENLGTKPNLERTKKKKHGRFDPEVWVSGCMWVADQEPWTTLTPHLTTHLCHADMQTRTLII